jgi:tetratricopeptide (TPR) repeat protein
VALLFESRMIQWHDAVRTRELLDEAAAKLEEAVRRDPNSFSFNYDLAVVYHSTANVAFAGNWDVALDYYRRTEAQCLRAGKLSPDEVNTQLLLVHALASQAAIMTHRDMPATFELCRRAEVIFATLGKQGEVEGQNAWDWANALARMGYALAWPDLPRALRLFDAASEKFKQACVVEEKQAMILSDWGKMLGSKAQGLAWKGTLSAARQAWAESRERLVAKQQLEPAVPDASVEIGLTLLREYASLPATERVTNQSLLDEAEKVQLVAEAMSPGIGAYNLACIYAWRNRPGECVAWLEQARKFGRLPAQSYVKGDPFLGLVAKSDEFTQWLAAAYPGQ